jgi:hypothetical protein
MNLLKRKREYKHKKCYTGERKKREQQKDRGQNKRATKTQTANTQIKQQTPTGHAKQLQKA